MVEDVERVSGIVFPDRRIEPWRAVPPSPPARAHYAFGISDLIWVFGVVCGVCWLIWAF